MSICRALTKNGFLLLLAASLAWGCSGFDLVRSDLGGDVTNETGIEDGSDLEESSDKETGPDEGMLMQPEWAILSPLSETEVEIQFIDQSSNETGHRVLRRLVERRGEEINETFASIAQIPSSQEQRIAINRTIALMDSNLEDESTYEYQLIAYNDTDTESSPVSRVTTLTARPRAPTNLTGSIDRNRNVDLTWIDRSNNENRFVVERSVDGGSYAEHMSMATLDRLGMGGEVSYRDPAVALNHVYRYRVRSANQRGTSLSSNEVIIDSNDRRPSPPADLSAIVQSSSSIRLQWQDTSSDEIRFLIERRENGGSFAQVHETGANATQWIDSGLDARTSYIYRVRAQNSFGFSPFSNEASATTQDQLPARPQLVSAVALSETSLRIVFNDVAANSTGTRVFEVTNSSEQLRRTYVRPYSNPLIFEASSLTPDTEYTYRIYAFNTAGNSVALQVTVTTPPVMDQLNSPGYENYDLLGSTRIRLKWRDRNANEDGHRVKRIEVGGGETLLSEVFSSQSEREDDFRLMSHEVSGLTPGESYHFRIAAFRGAEEAARDWFITMPEDEPRPPAPTHVSATALDMTRIRVSWSYSHPDPTLFFIDVIDLDSGEREFGSASGMARSGTVLCLRAGRTYQVNVEAYISNDGTSDPSPTTEVTTLPDNGSVPPSVDSLTMVNKSTNTVTVHWQETSNTERFRFQIWALDNPNEVYSEELCPAGEGYQQKRFYRAELTADKEYEIRIQGRNANGDSSWTEPMLFRTRTEPHPEFWSDCSERDHAICRQRMGRSDAHCHNVPYGGGQPNCTIACTPETDDVCPGNSACQPHTALNRNYTSDKSLHNTYKYGCVRGASRLQIGPTLDCDAHGKDCDTSSDCYETPGAYCIGSHGDSFCTCSCDPGQGALPWGQHCTGRYDSEGACGVGSGGEFSCVANFPRRSGWRGN